MGLLRALGPCKDWPHGLGEHENTTVSLETSFQRFQRSLRVSSTSRQSSETAASRRKHLFGSTWDFSEPWARAKIVPMASVSTKTRLLAWKLVFNAFNGRCGCPPRRDGEKRRLHRVGNIFLDRHGTSQSPGPVQRLSPWSPIDVSRAKAYVSLRM
jgi:hypothetical protein